MKKFLVLLSLAVTLVLCQDNCWRPYIYTDYIQSTAKSILIENKFKTPVSMVLDESFIALSIGKEDIGTRKQRAMWKNITSLSIIIDNRMYVDITRDVLGYVVNVTKNFTRACNGEFVTLGALLQGTPANVLRGRLVIAMNRRNMPELRQHISVVYNTEKRRRSAPESATPRPTRSIRTTNGPTNPPPANNGCAHMMYYDENAEGCVSCANLERKKDTQEWRDRCGWQLQVRPSTHS